MTFCKPEEGAPSDDRPQTEPRDHLTRGQLEEDNLGPLPTLSPELEHFLDTPMTGWGMRGRWDYLPGPLIKNYDLWLGWWAHQLGTSHWWEKLTTIPKAGDIKTLAQKICTSFEVPAVQCRALRNQDYTAPLAPKCLRRGMFLPNNLSYQDVWQKPQLLTLAYVQALQYWAEEANPLAHSEPHPLEMSVKELRQHIGRYITFSESDIFEGLGNVIHEVKYRDMGIPPVDSTTSSIMADMEDAQLSPVETPPVDDTTVLVTEPNAEIQEDLPATWGASPMKLEATAAPTVVLVDKLASPPTLPSHKIKGRQEYLQWIQVHSSQKVATVGSVPYKSGEA